MRKRSSPPPMSGGSSLLVIFAVLCLTVFALLTLSTVSVDSRLAKSTTLAVTEYYAADAQAEEIFARLRLGEVPTGVSQDNGVYSYTCAISATQELQVQLEQAAAQWRVLRWQAVSTVDWQPVESIPVWGGEMEEME